MSHDKMLDLKVYDGRWNITAGYVMVGHHGRGYYGGVNYSRVYSNRVFYSRAHYGRGCDAILETVASISRDR